MSKLEIPKGKMTLEKLAYMTAKGFEAVDKRFEDLETRLEAKMGYRFDALSNRMDDFALRYVTHGDLDRVKTRIIRIEEELELPE